MEHLSDTVCGPSVISISGQMQEKIFFGNVSVNVVFTGWYRTPFQEK
jgi:hypothetical protein